MAATSDINNLFKGTGIVSFTRAFPTVLAKRDIGEVPLFRVDITAETQEYRTSRAGTKKVVLENTTNTQITCTIRMDEVVATNLAMALVSDVTQDTGGIDHISPLSAAYVEGELELVGQNDQGSKFTVTIPRWRVRPGGQALEFISQGDDFLGVEVTGLCRPDDNGANEVDIAETTPATASS